MKTEITEKGVGSAPQSHLQAQLIGLGFSLVFIGALSVLIPYCSPESVGNCRGKFAGDLLLDRNTGAFPYPFTIQNLMWIIFFAAIFEVCLRFLRANAEREQIMKSLLPEDNTTMLRSRELGPYFANANENVECKSYFLQRLITIVILQFQSSRSINQSTTLMYSSLDLFQHEIDLKYSMLRYLTWLIPTLGFIGTVIGIALALSQAGDVPDIQDPAAVKNWMQLLTSSLGVAFYTTLLALLQSAVLMLFMNIAQTREEMALNYAGQYCSSNLINRLYEE